MNIAHALTIPGFMSEVELSWLATRASESQCIAEIGCWQGRSTRALADNTRGVVFAIDTFQGAPELLYQLANKPPHWLFKTFTMNLIDRDNVVVIRQTSHNASLLFKYQGFDMIFLDGDHNYRAVVDDIQLWKPLVVPGGILCGHDIYDAIGVEQAVVELLPGAQVVDDTQLWWTRL